LQNAGINADADTGVALQGFAGREGAFSDHCHRQPSPAPGILQIGAKLSQSASNGRWGGMGRGHM
jgi:hypothetical protein